MKTTRSHAESEVVKEIKSKTSLAIQIEKKKQKRNGRTLQEELDTDDHLLTPLKIDEHFAEALNGNVNHHCRQE